MISALTELGKQIKKYRKIKRGEDNLIKVMAKSYNDLYIQRAYILTCMGALSTGFWPSEAMCKE